MKKILLFTIAILSLFSSGAQIPAGYYNSATGLTCQPLKTALKTITNNGAVTLSYTPGVWNAYQYTDIKPGTGNVIWDIYTDDNNSATPETYTFIYGPVSNGGNQCGNYMAEGDCYNREHTTPQSWFNNLAPMSSDVHMLLPTDGYINGRHSNFPYGNVISATYTSIDNQSKLGTGSALNYAYTGTVFMPFAAFRGDIARIALYMATRYEDQMISQDWAGTSTEANASMLSSTDESNAAMRRLQIYDDWQIRVFFDWMLADPVSQKEIDRNNGIYYQSGQANRNPFVDHPEYAAQIWQCTGLVPVTIISFNATKNNGNVLLKWEATQETGFKLYEVERSTDGIHYMKIGEVDGANLARYHFTDSRLPSAAVVYYRLKMIDIDGKFHYSSIAIARINNNISNILVYPNPATEGLRIKLTEKLTENSRMAISDAAGRIVKSLPVAVNEVNIFADVKTLAAGKYFVRISNSNQVINGSFTVVR